MYVFELHEGCKVTGIFALRSA